MPRRCGAADGATERMHTGDRERRVGAAVFGGFVAGAIFAGCVGAVVGAWASGTVASIALKDGGSRGRRRNGRLGRAGQDSNGNYGTHLPRVMARPLTPRDRAMVATGAALASEAATATAPPGAVAQAHAGNSSSVGSGERSIGFGSIAASGMSGYESASRASGSFTRSTSAGGVQGKERLAAVGTLPTAVPVAPPMLCPIAPRPDASGSFVSTPGSDWVVSPFKPDYDAVFVAYATDAASGGAGDSDSGSDGAPRLGSSMTAEAAREPLASTGLPRRTLARVWDLSDLDRDGRLDEWEFAVAMYLCKQFQETGKLPRYLPENVVPPCKRGASPLNPFV